jgi:hypothetical protein
MLKSKKNIRIVFSLLVGFAITFLVFFGLAAITSLVLDLEFEAFIVLFGLIMGTVSFGVLSAEVYDNLKS